MWSGRFISASQMRWLSLKAVKVETRAHGSTVHTQDHWVLQTRVLTFFLICLFTCSGFQSSITTEPQQSPLTLQPSTPTALTSFVLFLCWDRLSTTSLKIILCWDRLSTTSLKIRVTCHALHFSINQNFVSPSYSQKQSLHLILYKPIRAKENCKWIIMESVGPSGISRWLRSGKIWVEKVLGESQWYVQFSKESLLLFLG